MGGVLFALVRALGPAPAPPDARASGAAGGPDARLVCAALELGLHRSDPVVRRRLVQDMRFLGAGADETDDALFEQALALGLQESDPVVRRRLAQRLELAARDAVRADPPGDAELAAFLAAHPERFARPARIRLSQVFVSRQRHGAALERDARALLARLRREAVPPERAAAWGDPSLLPARTPLRAVGDLARDFGPRFADAVEALSTGEWSGPVASGFGLHLVYVVEREAARLPALAEVRDAVRDALEVERAHERLHASLPNGQEADPRALRAARPGYVVAPPRAIRILPERTSSMIPNGRSRSMKASIFSVSPATRSTSESTP